MQYSSECIATIIKNFISTVYYPHLAITHLYSQTNFMFKLIYVKVLVFVSKLVLYVVLYVVSVLSTKMSLRRT